MKIAVAIVEDESDISQELALLVDCAPDMQCVGHYPNLESARAMLPDLAPDVVLNRYSLAGWSGH